ncbi:hypothetical protein [Acinetobacter bereziniae]|uniref:hypothetical protein n=1 Tax=Acinetobacter bereziniae TaxID=106648 RepID=UPI00124FEED0|nr:hypothetical protein [Acinetobacter bereziniae]
MRDLNLKKYETLDNIFRYKSENIEFLKISIINDEVKIHGKVRSIFYLNQYVGLLGGEYKIKKVVNGALWSDFEIEGYSNEL